jgi:alkylation response protein AidB-like acyl-CoA dehydrogenase
VRPIRQIAGDAEFCEAFLDDVVVPADAMIGELHQGWSVAQTMLVYERGGGESGTVMVEPRKLAPDLVDLAGRVGRLEDPEVRQAIARAHANDFALYHLGRRISARIQGSANPQPGLAAYAKLAIGVFGPQRGRAAMEIGGSEALLWEEGEAMPTETVGYLNARQMAIAAGTNEVQRNGIGERVLGLPREPSFDSNKPFSEVVRDARSWNGKVS